MTTSQEDLHTFLVEADEVVKSVAAAMAQGTRQKFLVRVYQERRGWEILATIPEEDQRYTDLLLSMAKAKLRAACQCSTHVCLLSNCANAWKDVRCGFRALLGFMDDESTACIPMYELGRCPNREECQKQHPNYIKRLFVVVRTNLDPPVDKGSSSSNSVSSSKSVRSSVSVRSARSARNANRAESWNSDSPSGLTDGECPHSGFRGETPGGLPTTGVHPCPGQDPTVDVPPKDHMVSFCKISL